MDVFWQCFCTPAKYHCLQINSVLKDPLQNVEKKRGKSQVLFCSLGIRKVFLTGFWNLLIPPILTLPSITSRIHYFQKKTLEFPGTCFLTWDSQGFFMVFWICLIPPILILHSPEAFNLYKLTFRCVSLQSMDVFWQCFVHPQNTFFYKLSMCWKILSKIWKKLWNPQVFVLPGICKVFFRFLKCSNSAYPDFT